MLQIAPSVLAGIAARPETFLTAYNALGSATTPPAAFIRSVLGSPFASLSDDGCLATFASVVAHDASAPGTASLDPIAATLQQLLTASALASEHYCKLATLLALLGSPLLIPPDTVGGSTKAGVHFLAWLDTVPLNTGAHAQLVVSNVLANAYLLLDPMYAYALRIPYVGSGPNPSLSVVENAATMLQTPIASANLAVLDPAATAGVPQMLQTVINGVLGPEYISHDAVSGSEAWDGRVAQVIDNLG